MSPAGRGTGGSNLERGRTRAREGMVRSLKRPLDPGRRALEPGDVRRPSSGARSGTLIGQARQAYAALVLVTFIWGTTFVVVKVAVETIDPVVFVASRFAVGTLALLLVVGPRLRTLTRGALGRSVLLGLLLAAGFLLQTFGLRETLPARAAFITGLNVLFVPLMVAALDRLVPDRRTLLALGLAAVGTGVLFGPDLLAAGDGGGLLGDLLVLGCAVAFAAHIVGIARLARDLDASLSATVQLATVACITGLWVVLAGAPLPSDGGAGMAILYTGVLATALIFFLQTWAQQRLSATTTALIFALEPVFAAIVSVLTYGEVLTLPVLLGGGLILGAILLRAAAEEEHPAQAPSRP